MCAHSGHNYRLCVYGPYMLLLLQAVQDDWYIQMYYDDLPLWGFVGKTEKIIAKGESQYK